MPWVEGVKSWEDSERTAREFYAAFIVRNKFDFGIYKNDQFIGGCGINGPNWSIPSAHIGYWCRTSEQEKDIPGKHQQPSHFMLLNKLDLSG